MARLIITPEGGRFNIDHLVGYMTIDTKEDGVKLSVALPSGDTIAIVGGMNGDDADALVLALDAFMVGGDGNIVTLLTIMGCEERSLDIFDIDLFLRKQGELTS